MVTQIKQCLQCGVDFEAERSTAKFHSDACKVAYNRSHTDEEFLPTIEPEKISAEIPKEMTQKELRQASSDAVAERKSKDKWGHVCSLVDWKRYPTMCENKAQSEAINELYSLFTSKELIAAGIIPPKWKQHYATYAEMRTALDADMEKYAMKDFKEPIDYSNWK